MTDDKMIDDGKLPRLDPATMGRRMRSLYHNADQEGFVGKVDGTVFVTGREGYIYVTMQSGTTGLSELEVHNAYGVPEIAGYPVVIRPDPSNGYWYPHHNPAKQNGFALNNPASGIHRSNIRITDGTNTGYGLTELNVNAFSDLGDGSYEIVTDLGYERWDSLAPPETTNANDDEFDDGVLDPSWTAYLGSPNLTYDENRWMYNYLNVQNSNAGGVSIQGYYKSVTVGPAWTMVDIYMGRSSFGTISSTNNVSGIGIFTGNLAANTVYIIGMRGDNTTQLSYPVFDEYTNSSTFGANIGTGPLPVLTGWFRAVYQASNKRLYGFWSTDGRTWFNLGFATLSANPPYMGLAFNPETDLVFHNFDFWRYRTDTSTVTGGSIAAIPNFIRYDTRGRFL